MPNYQRKPGKFVIPLCTCWFIESGVLMCVSKRAERSVENYNMLIHLLAQLSNDGNARLRMLLDFSRTELPSRAVRDFLVVELPRYLHSLAIFSATPMGSEVGKATVIMLDAPYPLRVFSDIREAEKWLISL